MLKTSTLVAALSSAGLVLVMLVLSRMDYWGNYPDDHVEIYRQIEMLREQITTLKAEKSADPLREEIHKAEKSPPSQPEEAPAIKAEIASEKAEKSLSPASTSSSCKLRVRKENRIPPLTPGQETARQGLMACAARLLAPIVGELKQLDQNVVLVDCVDEFGAMCKNLLISADKVGLRNVAVLTSDMRICKLLKNNLGTGRWCLDQTEILDLAKQHLDTGEHCHNAVDKSLSFFSQSSGRLVDIMMTRSFMWYELTKNGIGILAVDADVVFTRNPFANQEGKKNQYMVQLSAALVKQRKFFGGNGVCHGPCHQAVYNSEGVHIMCACLPPPYIATPSAEFWFERHTYLAIQCQNDIQDTTTRDLNVPFYQQLRSLPQKTEALTGTLKLGYGLTESDLLAEFQADLNVSKFEPLEAGCDATDLKMRIIPMNEIVSRCSHPQPIDLNNEDMPGLYAVHGNCASHRTSTASLKLIDKATWFNNSGLWYLDELILPLPDA